MVSMSRSGTYISLGFVMVLGSRLSEPLPPCLASSPRPAVSGNGASRLDTALRSAVKSTTCSTIRWMTSLACCTLPRQPSMVALRIAPRFASNTEGPDNAVRVRAFIFDRDEHDALGRARHLPNQQAGPQEANRM